jgi:hypothetical protein
VYVFVWGVRVFAADNACLNGERGLRNTGMSSDIVCVQTLNVSNNVLQDAGIEALFRPPPPTLPRSHGNSTVTACEGMKHAVKAWPMLSRLDLSNNQLSAHGCGVVVVAELLLELQVSSHITTTSCLTMPL